MSIRRLCLALVSVAASFVALLALLVAPGLAAGKGGAIQFDARLGGYQEVPSVSTDGRGQLRLALSEDGQRLTYELTYADLSGPPAAAHLHFAQRRVNGGVVAFLCGGGGKPACPSAPAGEVRGTIAAADVVGPAAQGIAPGEFAELVRALRRDRIYANVHTAAFPGGEIRGQLDEAGHDNPEDDD